MKNETRKQKRIHFAMLGMTVLIGSTLNASDNLPDATIFGEWAEQSSVTFTDRDGNPAILTNNSDLVLTSTWSGNSSPSWTWRLNSLIFDAQIQRAFWLDGGTYYIGAGGMTFLKNSSWHVGSRPESSRRIVLTSNQEWKGTEQAYPGGSSTSVGSRAEVSIGWNYGTYYQMGLGVEPEVSSLAISRYLDVWFFGQNTQLGNLDITVASPARLRIPKDKGPADAPVTIDARLGCRSLTLSGNGDVLELGQTVYANDTRSTLVTALDQLHFAPVLNLLDGADVSVQGTGVFAIPTVNVSKAVGAEDEVSVISGVYVVTQSVTAVMFSGEATLDFSESTLTEDGVKAGWMFSGAGTAKFSGDTYGLTGDISIGEEATVVFAGAMSFADNALIGEGTLILDPGADEEVVVSDLSNFDGIVRIVSGTAIVLKGASGAKIVEDGGKVIVSGGMIVTDDVRAESEITVGVGETLKIYGNGLTASTSIVLDGGSMAFKRDASAVASPIMVVKPACIYSGTEGSTNVISGFVTCDITNKVAGGLTVDGYGCMRFAGGMRMTLPGEKWWELANYNTLSVRGGCVLMTDGDYDMGVGPLKVGLGNGTLWGRYLGILDDATVHFADRKNGDGAVRVCLSLCPPVDDVNYNRYKTRIEIGEGGALELPWNSYFDVSANQSYAEVMLDGGSLTLNRYARLRLGTGGYSTGDLIIRRGTLMLNASILHVEGTDESRLLWYGGTIRLGEYFGAAVLFDDNAASGAGTATFRSSCQILGNECILDLGDCSRSLIANVPADREHAEWIGNGTLKVVGGATCRELVMNTFPSDITLCLSNDVTVAIPEGAKVYDSQKSQYAWRKPYRGFTPTDDWQTGGDVYLAALQLEDAESLFENRVADRSVSVGTIRVCPGGAYGSDNRCVEASSVSFTNVVFETGAKWVIGSTCLNVPGVLSFGAMVYVAESQKPAYGPVLATAGESLIGNPVVEKDGKRRVRCVFDAIAKEVRQVFDGLIITVR